ncbi:hypothetical protein [Rhodobacter ferrooxidans]|uniref:Tetratricopeptide repeat-like domain-containing protein n=1 Tax=Rhodobacter ferrooxidans TaxID=371731 RepID=C8RZB2_9RHOB|nr:hypothetical protein [Rhodobacter sp. SW2]EEW26069.1 conserved hypothetical protein [Rhodobacter sp. SW2]
MSTPDSFINEVTDEVRRDRLFATFRKYGWIGILLVVLVVGGAAFSEWNKASKRAAAQAFGDAVLAALEAPDPAARRAALAAVPASGDRAAILNLMLASDPATDRAGALAALDKVAADTTLPVAYRDLAVLRRVVLAGADMAVADRRAALDPIAAPGRPFRPLALEQLAYLQIEAGDTAAAITALQALTVDQEAPSGLRQRAVQVIVALGGDAAQG